MRGVATVVLLLAVPALSGCTAGPGGASTSTPSHTCPQWIPGLSQAVVHGGFDQRLANNPTNDTFLDNMPLEDEGRPVDVFHIHMKGSRTEADRTYAQGIDVTDARVHFKFFRLDNHDPLLAYDIDQGTPGKNPGQFDWVFGPGRSEVVLMVRLSNPPAMPRPAGLLVEYEYDMNLDGNPDTISRATWDYWVQYSYRVTDC